MTITDRLFLVLVTLTAGVGWDQATKKLAAFALKGSGPHRYLANLLRLEYAENKGAFLGLGGALPEPQRWAILIVAASLLLLGLTLFVCLKHDLGAADTVGYGFILAGGISNMLNRVASGFVVDFLNLGIGGLRTGIFNLADVSIMCGFVVVAWSHWLKTRQTVPVSS